MVLRQNSLTTIDQIFVPHKHADCCCVRSFFHVFVYCGRVYLLACCFASQTVEPEQLGAFYKPGGGVIEPTLHPPPDLRMGGIQGEAMCVCFRMILPFLPVDIQHTQCPC